MVVLIVLPDREAESRDLAALLVDLDPELEVRVWPEVGDPSEVEVVVAWRHPTGLLRSFPGLRLIVSFGAGVEHLGSDEGLPPGVPIVRTVDDTLVRDMVEYVLMMVAVHRRQLESYRDAQLRRAWRPRTYRRDPRLLVLGAGRLGGAVARSFARLGYRVTVWSRRGSSAGAGIRSLSGRQALQQVLPESHVVVCLLPLTPATRGLLDARFFALMRRGSLLVNVGRGAHVVESDLLEALDAGRPGCATLDVVATEPLPPEHPFWAHPRIMLTPHVAALTDPRSAAERVADSCRRLREGIELRDVVDPELGY